MSRTEVRTIAIVGATLIDGTGADPLRDAVVLVEGDSIAAAGPRSAVDLPADAEITDAGGRFLLPGLIDAHVHISAPDL